MARTAATAWITSWRQRRTAARELPARQDGTYQEILSLAQSPLSSSTSLPAHHTRKPPTTPSLVRSGTTIKLRRIQDSGRRVFVNLPLPKYELLPNGQPKTVYTTNKVRTSKYTLLTFIPKNLFEQFRRAANVYFLIMAILQLIPYFNVDSPALTLLPICFVVAITALKDGFEDYQRHKVDQRYNGTITHTLIGYDNANYPRGPSPSPWQRLTSWLRPSKSTVNAADAQSTPANDASNRGSFGRSLSMDVRVGDFVLLRNGESVPADCILLSSSDASGICYVETKDLDGETNLKPRKGIPDLKHIQSGAECLDDCHFYMEAGPPTPDLYSFEGTLVMLEKKPREGAGSTPNPDAAGDVWVEKKKMPLSADNLLLRGHVVRNTQWAIAIVLFTGTETKIILNSGETPSKRSRIEKQMNQEVIIAFVVLFFLCLLCAILAGVMKAEDDRDAAATLYSTERNSPTFVGFTNFWASLITFQNIIPISLYVSIEFVKTFQAFFIWSDLDMYDSETDAPCIPRSWNLSDDLGQVEYLFSDKTGTLTRNIMEFRECTIGGRRYGNNGFAPESEGARGARLRRERQEQGAQHAEEERASQDMRLLPLEGGSNAEVPLEKRREAIFAEYKEAVASVFQPRYSSLDPTRLSFADPALFWHMSSDDSPTKTSAISDHAYSQRDYIQEFFMLLALCHTVVVDKVDKDGRVIVEDGDDTEDDEEKTQPQVIDDGTTPNEKSPSFKEVMRKRHQKFKKGIRKRSSKKHGLRRTSTRGHEFESITNVERPDIVDSTVEVQVVYKAESPDEAALVTAARNAGFAFLARQGQQLTVDILGQEHTFELLDVLEFNSTRKRMSVILRRPEPWNDIVLYCKGADNVVFERLDPSHQGSSLLGQTVSDVEAFSNDGLRTLVLAWRSLNPDEYEAWRVKIERARTATENRSQQMDMLYDEIERNLHLLGATGIEDKLQEGVPQCIEDLRKAGIKVWVLTGDKLETAINIGYASNLLDSDMTLWTVRGPSPDTPSPDQQLSQELRNISNQIQASTSENALIVEGSALNCIFESSETKKLLLDVALLCKSVVCCRVSPLQKALVVELVRDSQDAVTLAVGDGANDVSMIQAANVGVGIAGKEGVQASMASDYAIAQFRFLQKLLLVHGHWSYERIAEMILNFFYKNIIWVFPSLWFQIYSRFSGNIFYDYSFLQLYNLIFTVAPVVVLGATDQDITARYLLKYPEVYQIGIQHRLYTRTRYWLYFADAVWQSLVLFYAFYFVYNNHTPIPYGYPTSLLQFSTAVALAVVTIANIVPGFNTYYWTWFQFVFVIAEIIVTFLWVVIYGLFTHVELYGMARMLLGVWMFWLTFAVSVTVAFLPRYIVSFVNQWWFADVMATVRQVEYVDKRKRRKADQHLGDTEKRSGFRAWLRACC